MFQPIKFKVNGVNYWIDEFQDGFAWSSNEDQGASFPAPLEAQQDALTREAMIIRDREADLAERLEDECFGTFREQVDALYHSTRL